MHVRGVVEKLCVCVCMCGKSMRLHFLYDDDDDDRVGCYTMCGRRGWTRRVAMEEDNNVATLKSKQQYKEVK